MDTLRLLIIEDESSQILIYQDLINQCNKEHDFNIVADYCKSFHEGSQALLSPYYDGAIIDLKLSTSPELEGVELVQKVYRRIRIPLFVVSGSLSQIDHLEENALFKKRERTSDLLIVINEIIEIFSTGLTSFLKPNGILDEKLNSIFWDNLSKDINTWIGHKNPKGLLRYIFSHVQEHLDINLEGDFEPYHTSEVYIKPPIKRNIHTGDLLTYNGGKYIVLTPACDIVFNYRKNSKGEIEPFRKSEKMMVAKVEAFDVHSTCLNKEGKIDKGKIKEYVKNDGFRFHYLPPFDTDTGFLIDFQQVLNIAYDEIFVRIAAISSPFIKDIISRFSNYYSRQGQPTFGQGELVEGIYKAKTKSTD